MKKNNSTILNILIVGIIILLVTSKNYAQDDIPKYGNDSINCIKNLSLYSEFYKQKNFDDAFVPWNAAITECPRSSKNLYIHGDKMMKQRIKKEKNKVIKDILIDSLLMLYDQRIQYFGQEGFVIGRKGNSLMKYRPAKFEEAYGYFERCFELEGKKIEAQILVLYMQTTDALYKSEKIDKEKVVENYSKILDVTEIKIKNFEGKIKEKNKEKYIKKKESILKAKNNIEIIFDQSGAASCESLVSLYSDKFEESPENLELLKKITNMLDKYECNESKLFEKTSEQLYKLEPSAQSAYMLAKLFLKKGEYAKSTIYYKEAIENQEDSVIKARYYYELGVLTHSQQSTPELARSYAYKALKFNPKKGKPYLLIGNIYAASAKNCGENEFEKSAVYWAVVDKYKTAKRMDTSLIDDANKLIETYSKYFPDKETSFFHEAHEGNEHQVGCWINETTKVRF